MAKPISDGRMIRKDISGSDGFNSLSDRAAVLFCMLIPHLNPFGKMNGGPGYVKEIVCPKRASMTYENLPDLLAEIGEKTNVKWFQHDGRWWLHSLHFLSEHQKLEVKKLGKDLLPNYPGTPGQVADKSATCPEPLSDQSAPSRSSNVNENVKENERDPCAREESSEQSEPLAAHAFSRFKELMPLRNGKFLDEEGSRDLWASKPARWNQWIGAAKNYRASAEVAAGAVCSPMTFLLRKWTDWQDPEQPLGREAVAPDRAWAEERERDEAEIAEFERQAAAGEIPVRPRDRLPHETAEEYERKVRDGTVQMVRAG